mgnify:CR=1 FL=1
MSWGKIVLFSGFKPAILIILYVFVFYPVYSENLDDDFAILRFHNLDTDKKKKKDEKIIIKKEEKIVTEIIKRTIAILPFHDTNDSESDEYTKMIQEIIHSKFAEKNLYIFARLSEIEEKAKELGIGIKELSEDEKSAGYLAIELYSDTVIFGKYKKIGDQLVIKAVCYDIALEKTVASVDNTIDINPKTIKNDINIKIAKPLSDLVVENLPKLDKEVFLEMILNKEIVIEEKDRDVIKDLLKQKKKYREVVVERGGEKISFAIPRMYNAVIIVRDQPGIFNIEYNDSIFESTDQGIKIFCFDNDIGESRKFRAKLNGNKSINIDYIQKKDAEVVIKRVKFEKDQLFWTLARLNQPLLKSAISLTGISITTLLGGGTLFGLMSYYSYMRNNTPDDQPDIWLSYERIAYPLFYSSISTLSLGGGVLIAMLAIWGFYGYYYGYNTKIKKDKTTFEFDINVNNDSLGIGFVLRF